MENDDRDPIDPFGKTKNASKFYSKRHIQRLVKAAVEKKSLEIENVLYTTEGIDRGDTLSFIPSQDKEALSCGESSCFGNLNSTATSTIGQEMSQENVYMSYELSTTEVIDKGATFGSPASQTQEVLPNVDSSCFTELPATTSITRQGNITKEMIRAWALKHSATHSSVNELLKIFRLDYPEFPKDSCTLLKTQCHYTIKKLLKGEYNHFRLLNGIKNQIKDGCHETVLKVSIGIDGLPLYKSSAPEFWPILGLINNLPEASVFIIGIYCGRGKPLPVDDFLFDFINEAKEVSSGHILDGKEFGVQIGPFICDAPARAYVKCVKSHNGYFGCDKCIQEGTWEN